MEKPRLADAPVFGVPYDELPATIGSCPDIFTFIINFFKKNPDDFRSILFIQCKLLPDLQDNTGTPSSQMVEIFNVFIKLLCQLPEPFIPASIMVAFLSDPCITSANNLLVALPKNKKGIFQAFIKLLAQAQEMLLHPLQLDKLFGNAFARQNSLDLFSLLSQQKSSYLTFPFIPFSTVVPDPSKQLYPTIETISGPFHIQDIVTPTIQIDEKETITYKLTELYSETKFRASSYGLDLQDYDSISEMSPEDIRKYKDTLKRVLVDFEKEFRSITKHKPTIEDKEPLTELYRLHDKLRRAGHTKSYELNMLYREKTILRKELNAYRTDFENTYGRKIASAEDKLPIKDKYARYKEIKLRINELEESESQISGIP